MKLTLKQWRLLRGLTQAKLAEALGVSITTVGDWERGAEPSGKKLQAIARVLEVSADDILLG